MQYVLLLTLFFAFPLYGQSPCCECTPWELEGPVIQYDVEYCSVVDWVEVPCWSCEPVVEYVVKPHCKRVYYCEERCGCKKIPRYYTETYEKLVPYCRYERVPKTRYKKVCRCEKRYVPCKTGMRWVCNPCK